MTSPSEPLRTKKDNLLGICNALGEDFGFNPLWLRLALGAAFVIQPVNVVIGYLALGLVVLMSRLAFPEGKGSMHDLREESVELPAQETTSAPVEEYPLAKAA